MFCAVFNLVPRAWKLGVEVMDLRRVNLFTPFLSPVLPYLGARDVRPRGHSGFDVWAVDLVKFRLGFFPKFGFGVFSDVPQGSVLASWELSYVTSSPLSVV